MMRPLYVRMIAVFSASLAFGWGDQGHRLVADIAEAQLANHTAVLDQSVYAFDDTVRTVSGDTTVEAPRWSIREGRVALVANGPAAFSMVAVDALDLYRFDFLTSHYTSFPEHIRSWDGRLIELPEGSGGAGSTPLATLFASDASAIAAAMTAAADPQARQVLFTHWVNSLALPLRQQPEALCLIPLLAARDFCNRTNRGLADGEV